MSIEELNTNILREAYQKWHDTRGASIDHWMSLLGDRIDFRSLADGEGGLNFSGQAETRADMNRYFSGLTGSMEMIHCTVDDIIAQDDRVVVVGTTSWRVKKTGKVFETPKVDVIRLEGGKIVSFFEYYDTAKIMAANRP